MSGINPRGFKESSTLPGIINQGTGKEKIFVKWLTGPYFFEKFTVKSFFQGTVFDVDLGKVSKNARLNVTKIINMAIILRRNAATNIRGIVPEINN
jgi:hypothetical protein